MQAATASDGPTVRKPLHLRPKYVVLVMLGGFVGTLLRALVNQAMHRQSATFPWGTLLVNLVGAAILPGLLELIAGFRRRHVAWRLMLGTGLMGGFTTYSAFSVETMGLLQQHRPVAALVYVLITLCGGLLLSLVSATAGAQLREVRS